MNAPADIAIVGAGMVTPVGLDAPSSCAAFRCRLSAFEETRFISKAGAWIMAAEAPLEEPWRGRAKLLKMAARAWRECISHRPNKTADAPALVLCVAEAGRPGREEELGAALYLELQRALSVRFPKGSIVVEGGRAGGARGLEAARALLAGGAACVVLLGVDGFVNARSLAAYDAADRLLTEDNSNGFIPGEAAAAILLTRADEAGPDALRLAGLGFAEEKATIDSEAPLRADGLAGAIKAALAEARLAMHEIDYRMTDISGEQYYFKEAALALSRVLRERVERMDIEHPAECVGETGAAALPLMLGATLAAQRKGYAQGPTVLAHVSGDDGARAALALRYGVAGARQAGGPYGQ